MEREKRFDYFEPASTQLLSYFRIPKALITDPEFKGISTDAKLLYGLMLDRMALSTENGWVDDDNHVFIVYTYDDVRETLGCAAEKASKLFAELESVQLIERRRQGAGKPSLIYVKNFSAKPLRKSKIMSSEIENHVFDNRNSRLRFSKSNKTEINKTERSEYPARPRAREEDAEFVPPTEAEVAEYVAGRDVRIDARKFYLYYQARGWKICGEQITDWRAQVRQWEITEAERRKPLGGQMRDLQPTTYNIEEFETELFANAMEQASKKYAEAGEKYAG